MSSVSVTMKTYMCEDCGFLYGVPDAPYRGPHGCPACLKRRFGVLLDEKLDLEGKVYRLERRLRRSQK